MTSNWIVVAGDARVANLVATAQQIGGAVGALVVGSEELAQHVAGAGVDRTIWLGDPGAAPLEAFAQPVAEVIAGELPTVVLGAARDPERVLLGAVAARLPAPLFVMPKQITAATDHLEIRTPAFGGIADDTVRVEGPAVAMLDGGGLVQGTGQGSVERLVAAGVADARVTRTVPPTRAQVDLGRAERIVAVGRGLRAQEDLALIQQLADALDAEVACSRPLAEGLEWLNADRYIGVTGQHVAPKLYVAVGISGQLQHVVGARGARHVVVINNDENAPYFSEADYGIVGNLYDVVPALVSALGQEPT
jgi:electron transfer flavoprotein alpha subunit